MGVKQVLDMVGTLRIELSIAILSGSPNLPDTDAYKYGTPCRDRTDTGWLLKPLPLHWAKGACAEEE